MLSLSSTALAEWEDASSLTLYNFTSATSVSSSVLRTSPIATSATDSIGFLRSGSLSRYPVGVIPSGDKVAFVVFENGNGWITSGTKFRFQVGSSVSFGDFGGQNGAECTTRNRRYYARNGSNWVEITPGHDGVFSLAYSPSWLAVAFVVEDVPSTSGYNQYVMTTIPYRHLLVEIPDPTFQSTIEDQTEELTSTQGSGNIVDSVVSSGEDIAGGLGFVTQTAQFTGGVFDAFADADATSGITFPGISLMGFSIPSQTVSFTGYFSQAIEDTIRAFVTMVCFIAWVNGLRAIYHRLFLGEIEVQIVDGEE